MVCKVLVGIVLVLAVGVGFLMLKLHERKPLPNLPQDAWWGPGTPKTQEDKAITPFKINVSDKVLEDLKYRLDNTRPFAPPLEGTQQQYGINTNMLQEIITFWKTKYDWRAREKFLNQYPQYTTVIQGMRLHYMHVKPKKVPAGVKVLPMMILHGWPGSTREFYGLIPLLTTVDPSRDFVFELILPSLPGYGFSEGASKPGLGSAQMAVVMKNLMDRIGFKKYYLQGGDWGAAINSNIAMFYPENILGVHSTMCINWTALSFFKLLLGSLYPSAIVDPQHASKLYPLKNMFFMVMQEFGYMHQHATKPDTVGVALIDSPVGLAAYLLEKFSTWTNRGFVELPDAGLSRKFDIADLLDNVMIYWVTGTITSSMRLYAETFNKHQLGMKIDTNQVTVPYACTRFEHELFYYPDSLLRDKFVNLVHSADFDDGGHFASFEVPKMVAGDVFVAVGKMEKLSRNADARKAEL